MPKKRIKFKLNWLRLDIYFEMLTILLIEKNIYKLTFVLVYNIKSNQNIVSYSFEPVFDAQFGTQLQNTI